MGDAPSLVSTSHPPINGILNATVVVIGNSLSLSASDVSSSSSPSTNYEASEVPTINTNNSTSILYQFQSFYDPIHGYLGLCVCLFGIFTNILNIIVLTRKDLISATNSILTGLAVADMLVMMDYIPFNINNYVQHYDIEAEKFSYAWAVYTLFHQHFSVIFHTISTWLTVSLAIWRYISVKFPTQSRSWCTLSTSRRLILATYLVVPIYCAPMYPSYAIMDDSCNGGECYKITNSEIAMARGELLKRINFWLFSGGCKLVPCVLLTYLTWALINVVYAADKRKRRLKENCYTLAASSSSNVKKINCTPDSGLETSDNSSSKELNPTFRKVKSHSVAGGPGGHSGSHDRTTRMLLAILLLFLICQLPNGFLTFLIGINDDAYIKLYQPLSALLDMLSLINSAVNFILYCTMSEQFRYTFAKLFFL
ncbi:G-protein coupled receptor dmsr-1-like [Brevipalpus obovatus]|uniref:G-protein coupled receptor dmsr-1-like n=1 Tax=Brevipalpus obovatus TaxID=246614 RepID=UPI003D9DF8D8